jgi:hypothetical protein
MASKLSQSAIVAQTHEEQNLLELVRDAFRLARVLSPRKMMQKKA